MSDDTDFLTRWSRRKLEARKESARESEVAGGSDEADATVESGAAPPAAEDQAAGPPPDLQEQLALLPSVEELTAESDLTPFMRNGVPAALRNAALRRMWVLDPAIRDYVGDARDYAYDWSVPGSVPGSGPLARTEELITAARRIVGRFPATPEGDLEPGAGEAPVAADDTASAAIAESASVGPPAVAADAPQAPSTAALKMPEPEPPLATPAKPDHAAERPIRRRRHGGAMPI
ncbi:MAG TPA: DUF3306 domain-containing protein [Geminicoccus sp.]|uniref:DUF3306 domain-containing protein n=1 Tax=Geminicoccus sp. TaxID=2024832 RepID=UPI002CDC4D1E|nr:DUF3306 domain-containing protein [Geminicoccus sp.]HWL70234.1 DUF3306 domain-containing protein [Geminicoccus sp.]